MNSAACMRWGGFEKDAVSNGKRFIYQKLYGAAWVKVGEGESLFHFGYKFAVNTHFPSVIREYRLQGYVFYVTLKNSWTRGKFSLLITHLLSHHFIFYTEVCKNIHLCPAPLRKTQYWPWLLIITADRSWSRTSWFLLLKAVPIGQQAQPSAHQEKDALKHNPDVAERE